MVERVCGNRIDRRCSSFRYRSCQVQVQGLESKPLRLHRHLLSLKLVYSHRRVCRDVTQHAITVLRQCAEELAPGLQAAARASLFAVVEVGQHGLLLSDCARRVALSALTSASSPFPSHTQTPPALILLLAARIAIRSELAMLNVASAVGYHGEVLVDSTGEPAFSLPLISSSELFAIGASPDADRAQAVPILDCIVARGY